MAKSRILEKNSNSCQCYDGYEGAIRRVKDWINNPTIYPSSKIQKVFMSDESENLIELDLNQFKFLIKYWNKDEEKLNNLLAKMRNARNALINTHLNRIADDLLASQRAFFDEEEDLNY